MNSTELRTILTKLLKRVEELDAKVSQMPQIQIQVSSRLLPTLMVVQKIGSTTATQVSQITGRCRAFESKNLNELSMMGVLLKQRKRREKIFSVKAGGKIGV
jgi:hypothetical protein